MFDDPKKELKRPDNQFQAAKMSDEDFERFYDEIYAEFGEKKPQEDAELARLLGNGKTQSRKPAQSASQKKPQTSTRNAYSDNARAAAPAKKQKGIRGLVITACLECLGIVAVVVWWMLRIL